jgi:nucleotide-binding universal stress UspA family protein
MFRNILVPLDGSEFSERALEHAQDLAETNGGTVTLLTVLLRPEGEHLRVPKLDDQSRHHLEETLEAKAAQVEKSALVDNVETGVVFGEPAHQIAEYANDHDVDLIVMSTHGLGATGRYALGSVALKVLMTAPCPVFMVRIPSHGARKAA